MLPQNQPMDREKIIETADMDFKKSAICFNGFSDFCPGPVVRRNGSTNRNPAVFGDFSRNITDSLDIDIPVLF